MDFNACYHNVGFPNNNAGIILVTHVFITCNGHSFAIYYRKVAFLLYLPLDHTSDIMSNNFYRLLISPIQGQRGFIELRSFDS